MFPPIRPRPTKPSFVVVSATSAAADDRDEPKRALDLWAGLAERGPLQPCLLHRLSFASEVRGALSLCLHRQPVSQTPAAWNLRLAASFSARREPVAGSRGSHARVAGRHEHQSRTGPYGAFDAYEADLLHT